MFRKLFFYTIVNKYFFNIHSGFPGMTCGFRFIKITAISVGGLINWFKWAISRCRLRIRDGQIATVLVVNPFN